MEKGWFSINGAGPTDYLYVKSESWLLPYIIHKKINSWWITDINVKSSRVKHLKENTEDLYDIKIDKYFLN